MPTTWYTAKIIKIEEIAPNVKSFTLEVCDVEKFDFKPGQFITLDLPVSDKRLNRWRSYSIASIPNKNYVELCIVRNPVGIGTTYLFEKITVGDHLRFKGPEGGFIIKDPTASTVVMIATGTGVAPFRSMIQSTLINSDVTFHIHLIFGTRFKSGILYVQEFEKLAAQYPNFTYDVALSRETSKAYHHGYLHDLYLKKYTDKSQNVQFYICGWSNMIDESVSNLIEKLHFDRSKIIYELYG